MAHTKISNIIQDIGNLLLPVSCFGCNARLYRGEVIICTSCRHQLPLTEHNFNEENSVDRIFYGRINITKAASFLYLTNQGIVQNLIHSLKYRGQENVGILLGDWFGLLLKEKNNLNHIDYVIPVPLHKKRLKKRGYNQVSRFAERLAFHINSTYSNDFLIKTANTKTQTKKNRLSRWFDNKSLFEIKNAELLEGKNILIVDDVITTGATMEICARSFIKIKGVNLYLTSMAIVQ